MGNTANLRPPWKPGQSGNPNGRPKAVRQIDDLMELIRNKASERKISEIWLNKILEGDIRFLIEYLERRDGKVKDQIEVNQSLPEVRITLPAKNGDGTRDIGDWSSEGSADGIPGE